MKTNIPFQTQVRRAVQQIRKNRSDNCPVVSQLKSNLVFGKKRQPLTSSKLNFTLKGKKFAFPDEVSPVVSHNLQQMIFAVLHNKNASINNSIGCFEKMPSCNNSAVDSIRIILSPDQPQQQKQQKVENRAKLIFEGAIRPIQGDYKQIQLNQVNNVRPSKAKDKAQVENKQSIEKQKLQNQHKLIKDLKKAVCDLRKVKDKQFVAQGKDRQLPRSRQPKPILIRDEEVRLKLEQQRKKSSILMKQLILANQTRLKQQEMVQKINYLSYKLGVIEEQVEQGKRRLLDWEKSSQRKEWQVEGLDLRTGSRPLQMQGLSEELQREEEYIKRVRSKNGLPPEEDSAQQVIDLDMFVGDGEQDY